MLTTLYIACMTAGGGFVLLSILSGGDHETDVDGDIDLDADLDVDADADFDGGADLDVHLDAPSADIGGHGSAEIGHGIRRAQMLRVQRDRGELATQRSRFRPLRSFRFWTFGLTFFGMSGLLALYALSLPVVAQLAMAVPLGLVTGLGASWGMHRLSSSQDGSMTRSTRFLGADATVRVAIRGRVPGEISVDVGGRRHVLIATALADDYLEVGTVVTIIDFDEHRARVVTSADFFGGAGRTLPGEDGGEK